MGLTLAGPSVRGVSIVTGDARLAVFAGGQVLTSLADALVDTFAVPVTLAGWGQKKGKKRALVFLMDIQGSTSAGCPSARFS